MGQLIVSSLEKSNERKKIDFQAYKDYAAYGNQAIAADGTESSSHSATYRMANTSEEELARLRKTWYHDGSCLKEVEKFCKARGQKVCLAYRTLINVEKTTIVDKKGRQKTMETYVFDTKRQTMSYDLFWDNIISFGRGLASIGVKPKARVGIYEETRWQWLTTMYGCWTQDMVVTTVYANLGEDALAYALKETECDALVCNGSNVKKLIQLFDKCDISETAIVYTDQLPSDVDPGKHKLYRWGDVMHMGKDRRDLPFHVPDGSNCDDMALIMYTSGTTGNPKGVVHTHGSLYNGVMAIDQRVTELLGPIKSEEWYCSYLPLAHILEFVVSSILMLRGVIIGYGSPRTLMDQFAKPHGDLTEYSPRLVVAVPRVFDTMKKAVEEHLPKPGTLKRQIFDQAYQSRLKALQEGKDTPYYNEKVFSAARKVMGGSVYAMLSGGGPLSPETQEFINVVFGMVIQGYGLTETVCVGAIQRTGNLQYSTVGQIIKTCEVRLVDTVDFKHTDEPEPRGEICMRGPFLFKEYYKQPQMTKEALDEGGWFHTGDVGSMAPNGAVRLVGRVKALAKNANGEYIAMEALESIYGLNELVANSGVCILVNPHRSYVALLMLTDEKRVEDFKRKHKLHGRFPEILRDAEFQRLALASVQKTARDAKRKSFEVVQTVKLLNEVWTPANGVVTAALKLRRNIVEERYKTIIEELFHEQ